MSACVINLYTPAERFERAQQRKHEGKRALLNAIRDVNKATVHPLSHHYIDDSWSDRDIYLWAAFSDLLTAGERLLLSTC